MKEDAEKKIRELAEEAEFQQRQANEIRNQIITLQNIENEILRSEEAIKNLKEGNVSLFSIGSGIFVKGALKNVDKVLVNVGHGIIIEKTIDDSLTFLSERKKEIAEAKDELLKQIGIISERLKSIDKEAREIIQKEKGEKK
jgi:prefoldin alpha subunit